MGFKKEFKDKAKELGLEIADLAKKEGNDLIAQLKVKAAAELDDLKTKAIQQASLLVDEQSKKLSNKATDVLKKTKNA